VIIFLHCKTQRTLLLRSIDPDLFDKSGLFQEGHSVNWDGHCNGIGVEVRVSRCHLFRFLYKLKVFVALDCVVELEMVHWSLEGQKSIEKLLQSRRENLLS